MDCEIQVSYDGLKFYFEEDGYWSGNKVDMEEAIEECIQLIRFSSVIAVRLTIQGSANPEADTIFLATAHRRYYNFSCYNF